MYMYMIICCFLGQGREAGRNSICRSCCHSMHPWTGTSPPPHSVTAAAAESAPPPHDLNWHATDPQP